MATFANTDGSTNIRDNNDYNEYTRHQLAATVRCHLRVHHGLLQSIILATGSILARQAYRDDGTLQLYIYHRGVIEHNPQ